MVLNQDATLVGTPVQMIGIVAVQEFALKDM